VGHRAGRAGGVAPRHARLARCPDGILLEDLGSRNGTVVNGERVGRRVLADGDRIMLGRTVLKYAYQGRLEEDYQQRLYELSTRDGLTNLHNRRFFDERLATEVAFARRHGTRLGVLLLDIDHFKQVNDTIGHDGGDFLLSTIGKRLLAMTRVEDMVARLGGDEFVVVQTGVVDKSQADAFAKRLAHMLSRPAFFREQELHTSYTVGVALAPHDGATAERVLKSADLALYAGKMAGRDCIRFFSPEMDEALQKRIALEKMIRNAVATNGFVLHYQPIFELNTKNLMGFEALVRLSAPDGTLVPPANFIPMAEELHLIERIGAWVLHEACRTASTWPANQTVAVNLSPAQFESGDLETTVAAALKDRPL
jgi:diguanylate cyclase (GGDEF)-like protein